MAIVPRPPAPGPISFDHTHGDTFVRPAHLPNRPKTSYDPSIFPGPIDTSYDRDAAIASGEVPHVLPVMLGLQRVIAERREQKALSRLEELKQRQEVVNYIGKAILTGSGYLGIDNPDKPNTRKDMRTATRLERIMRKRRAEHAFAHNLWMPVNPKVSDKYDAAGNIVNRGFIDGPANPTPAESRLHKRHERVYHHLNKGIKHLDHKFETTVQEPSKQAARTRKKLESLSQKVDVLQERSDQRRENIIKNSKATARALRKGAAKTGELSLKAGKATAKAAHKAGRTVKTTAKHTKAAGKKTKEIAINKRESLRNWREDRRNRKSAAPISTPDTDAETGLDDIL